MMPKTLVVPLDGSPRSERALDVAAPLADELGADVVLLTTPWYDDRTAPRSYLASVVAQRDDAGFDTVVSSEPAAATAIRALVDDRPDSMVCMTTHGRGRLRWAVLGSVTETVIREATRPLLLVGPRGAPTWSRPGQQIIVCVDGSASDGAAIAAACEWARALDLEVVLAFVSHPLDTEAATHPDELLGPLAELVRAEGVPVRAELLRSSFVAGALIDFSEDIEATMLVMAAHHHPAVTRIVLGSVTMGVLNGAVCPVLVIPNSAPSG
jgi:nucleotide-binding universal stress UspA family protein